MKIIASEIAQVATVQMEPIEDRRGFFARQYCAQEFSAAGLNLTVVQTNISFNERRGTLRGMHYQAEPKPDPKLVHCTRGSIYDVAVDLRRDSPTFGNWFAATLDAENRLHKGEAGSAG